MVAHTATLIVSDHPGASRHPSSRGSAVQVRENGKRRDEIPLNKKEGNRNDTSSLTNSAKARLFGFSAQNVSLLAGSLGLPAGGRVRRKVQHIFRRQFFDDR